jgi:hypothetical protein
VIAINVGSDGLWGYTANILHSLSSACAVLVIAGIEAFLGEITISAPPLESYLLIAMLRVTTIFQVYRVRKVVREIYFVLKYSP